MVIFELMEHYSLHEKDVRKHLFHSLGRASELWTFASRYNLQRDEMLPLHMRQFLTENIFQTEIQTEATNWSPNWKHCNCFLWADVFNLKHLKRKQHGWAKFENFKNLGPDYSISVWTQSFQTFYLQNRRCPSLTVPSHVRWFQTCRSLPMWKLSPRSRGDVMQGEMDFLNPWKLTPHVWEKFRDSNETTYNHPQVVLQRSEIALRFAFEIRHLRMHLQRETLKDQRRSRGKVLATADCESDDWNVQGIHCVSFSRTTFPEDLSNNTHSRMWERIREFGTSLSVTVMEKCCLVL